MSTQDFSQLIPDLMSAIAEDESSGEAEELEIVNTAKNRVITGEKTFIFISLC